MTYEPRRIGPLGREGLMKHYGIALHGGMPREALVAATAAKAREVVPEGAFGFTIAHDAATAGLALVYWWANENEIHRTFFASPHDDPGAVAPYESTGITCVWEMEVLDFERRAWLEDVLQRDDREAYLRRTLAEVEI